MAARTLAPELMGLVGPFTKIARTMSQNWDLEIIPSGFKCATDGERISIPFTADHLPEEKRQELHGMLDHEVSHVAEERAHREAGRGTPVELMRMEPNKTMRMLLNVYEDIRIELKYGKRYPGMGENLNALNAGFVEKWRKDPSSFGNFWHKFGCAIISAARGMPLDWADPATLKLLELVEPEIEASKTTNWVQGCYDLAESTYDKLKAFAEHTKKMDLKSKEAEEKGEKDDEESDDEEGESASDDGEEMAEGEGEGSEGDESEDADGSEDEPDDEEDDEESEGTEGPEEESDDEGEDSEPSEASDEEDEDAGDDDHEGAGGEADEDESGDDEDSGSSGAEDGDGDEPDDKGVSAPSEEDLEAAKGIDSEAEVDDLSEKTRAELEDAVRKDVVTHRRYVPDPACRKLDRWIKPPRLLGMTNYNTARDEVSRQIGAIKAKQLAHIQTISRKRNVAGLESGHLDDSALASVRTGNNRVFKDVIKGRVLDTAIELLVDLSGSMGGGDMPGCAAYYAKRTTIALAEAWEPLRIPFEVTGFYNSYDRRGPPRTDPHMVWRQPFDFFIFKGWEERLAPCRERFTAIKGYGDNADGEAVWAAAIRLSQRPEKRKILVVISDGYPACGGIGTEDLNNHLKHVVKSITSHGIEVLGVGAGTDAPSKFYNKETGAQHIIIKDLEKLSVELFKVMRERLMGTAA